MTMARGAPVVRPFRVPDKIAGISLSRRVVAVLSRPGGAAGHLDVDFLHVQGLPGGQAVQNAADGFAVALPENGEAHPVTDGR